MGCLINGHGGGSATPEHGNNVSISTVKKNCFVYRFRRLVILSMLWIWTCLFSDASKPIAYANDEPIKIASIFAFSGEAADANHPSIMGVRNGVAILNRQGGVLGRPIKLIEIDNLSTPIGSQVAAQKAVNMGVCAIMGSAWSSHSMAVAKVAQQHGIPTISTVSTHPDVTKIGDYIFRVCFTDEVQGEVMAQLAFEMLCAENAVVCMNLNSNYSLILAQTFRKAFEKAGGRVLRQLTYKKGASLSRFMKLVDEIKSERPDVVFIPGYAESGTIIREMDAQGVEAVPLGADGWGYARFFETAGQKIPIGYYCDHWSALAPSDALTDYLANRKTDEPFWSAEALGVDGINILASAIEKAGGDTDRQKIRNEIARMQYQNGLTGSIRFDAVGNPEKKVVIMEIRDGKPQFVTSFSAEMANEALSMRSSCRK